MSTRLSLVVDTSKYFTTGDAIKGTAVLELSKSTDVTKLEVAICGVSNTNLTEIVEQGQRIKNEEHESYEVLNDVVVLFPSSDMAAHGFTMGAGRHEFKFESVLPTYAVPQGDIGTRTRKAVRLPPSMSDLHEDTMVQYYVQVSLYKPGRFSYPTTAKQHFVFLPADLDEPENGSDYGQVRTNGSVVLPGMSATGLWRRLNQWGRGRHKSCTDAFFELSSDTAIVPGVKFVPSITIVFPNIETTIVIESVLVDLVAITDAKALHIRREFERRIPLIKEKKLKLRYSSTNGHHQSLQLASGTTSIVPDEVGPTFETPNIHRRYELVAKIKYSHIPGSLAVHRAVMKLPVVVKSGISLPDYETGEVHMCQRKFEQDSLYYTLNTSEP